jgi:translation elongation factor P/translation initiation factor 5A
MRRLALIAVVAAAAWVTGGTARGQSAPGTAQPASTMGQMMTATATVEKVDLQKHEVTLKSSDGKPFTVQVPENVTRLENVKPGDKVDVGFYESVAVKLRKPGEPPIAERKESFGERTPGALPGAVTGQQITTSAKVVNVDHARSELTIETPTGKTNTIKVTDTQMGPAFKKLKAGDQIDVTYTEAMAISMTPRHHS